MPHMLCKFLTYLLFLYFSPHCHNITFQMLHSCSLASLPGQEYALPTEAREASEKHSATSPSHWRASCPSRLPYMRIMVSCPLSNVCVIVLLQGYCREDMPG